MTGGDYIVRVSYYEAAALADVHLGIEPVQWHHELRPTTSSSVPPQIFIKSNFGGVSPTFNLCVSNC